MPSLPLNLRLDSSLMTNRLSTSGPTPSAFHAQISSMNKIAPRPLPPCPEIFPGGSDLRKAFRVCSALESKERWVSFRADLVHTRSEGRVSRDLTPTCAARVLGFALLYSPSDRGRNNLAAEILKCDDGENDHELLGWLAHLYVYGLIRLCTLSINMAHHAS